MDRRWLFAFITLLVACGDDDPTSTVALDAVGAYTLTEVNGLPVGSDETTGIRAWTASSGCSVDDVQGQTTRVLLPGGELELQANGSFFLGLKGWYDCLIDGDIASRSPFSPGLRGSYQLVANELIFVINDEFDIHINRGIVEAQPDNQSIAGSVVMFIVEDAVGAGHEYNVRYVRQ